MKQLGTNGMEQDDLAEEFSGAFAEGLPEVGSEPVPFAPKPECAAASKLPGNVLIGWEAARFYATGADVFSPGSAKSGALAAWPLDGLSIQASRGRAGPEASVSWEREKRDVSLSGSDPDRRCRLGPRMAAGERMRAPGRASATGEQGALPE